MIHAGPHGPAFFLPCPHTRNQQNAIMVHPPCEGPTMIYLPLAMIITIHPPMRGADSFHDSMQSCIHDSSPHARGRRFKIWPGLHPLRFIPPCEGPTPSSITCTNGSMIHPPMRGADDLQFCICPSEFDSSPMRGADTQCLYRFECSSHCRCAICTISQCVYLIYYLLDEKNGPVRLILSQSHPAPSAPLLPQHPRLQYPR